MSGDIERKEQALCYLDQRVFEMQQPNYVDLSHLSNIPCYILGRPRLLADIFGKYSRSSFWKQQCDFHITISSFTWFGLSFDNSGGLHVIRLSEMQTYDMRYWIPVSESNASQKSTNLTSDRKWRCKALGVIIITDPELFRVAGQAVVPRWPTIK
jgi:hypothetical protein